jgi:hypothetical protein
VQVLATVLDGLPLYGLHTPMFEQWQEAASTLDAAISELGLWRTWFAADDLLRRNIGGYLYARGRNDLKQALQRDGEGVSYAQTLLRWQPTTSDPKDAIARFANVVGHSIDFADDNRLQAAAPLTERYEALFSWPLPRYVKIEPACRSVGELLAIFVSSPSAFTEGTPGAVDIVAFAAALLASRMEDRRREGWRERAAATWLARSVPRWLFRKDIEALIVDPENQHAVAAVGA